MSLIQIERDWFSARVTSTPSMSITELKRIYFKQQLQVSGGLKELEKLWLKKIITANGGTPVGNTTNDLLKQAMCALGIQPTRQATANWMKFYLGYNP